MEIVDRFTYTTPDGRQFSDAVYYTTEAWAATSEQDRATIRQTRLDNWLDATATPADPPAAPVPDPLVQSIVDAIAAAEEAVAAAGSVEEAQAAVAALSETVAAFTGG